MTGPGFAAIDFETAARGRESACAVGLAVVRDGRVARVERRLIRPPAREFVFTHVHGLTWEDVRDAPAFDEVWAGLSPMIAGLDFLAAHNAPFDRGVLAACCARYRLPPPAHPFICTARLARDVLGMRPARLSDVCRRLSIPLDHHEAGSDAEACARIVLAAAERGWRR